MSAFVYEIFIKGRKIINNPREYQKIVLDCNGPMPFKTGGCAKLEFWGHHFKGYQDSYDPSYRVSSIRHSPLSIKDRESFAIFI